MDIKEKVAQHNKIREEIEKKSEEAFVLADEIMERIEKMGEEEIIPIYNSMVDSELKFRVFLKIKDKKKRKKSQDKIKYTKKNGELK